MTITWIRDFRWMLSKVPPFLQPRTLSCGTVEVCQQGEDVNLDLLDVPLILHQVHRCVSMIGVFVWIALKKACARNGLSFSFEENKVIVIVMGEKMQYVRIVLISTNLIYRNSGHNVSITIGTIHGYCPCFGCKKKALWNPLPGRPC